MSDSTPHARNATRLLLIVLAVVAIGVGVWRGAEMFVLQERLRSSAAWLREAGDWQVTLFGTARAIDAGDLRRSPDGGFTVPWDPPDFPVTVEACEAKMLLLLGTYPLDLDALEEPRVAFRGSNALLTVEVARVTLETDTGLDAVVRALDRHGNDLGRLIAPVGVALADDGDALASEAFLIAGVLGAALLLILAVRLRRP